jgi:hypothetical protein
MYHCFQTVVSEQNQSPGFFNQQAFVLRLRLALACSVLKHVLSAVEGVLRSQSKCLLLSLVEASKDTSAQMVRQAHHERTEHVLPQADGHASQAPTSCINLMKNKINKYIYNQEERRFRF